MRAATLSDQRVSDRVLVPRSRAVEFGMDVVAYATETACDADQIIDAIFGGNRMRAIDRLNRITARSERIADEAREWTAAAEAAS